MVVNPGLNLGQLKTLRYPLRASEKILPNSSNNNIAQLNQDLLEYQGTHKAKGSEFKKNGLKNFTLTYSLHQKRLETQYINSNEYIDKAKAYLKESAKDLANYKTILHETGLINTDGDSITLDPSLLKQLDTEYWQGNFAKLSGNIDDRGPSTEAKDTDNKKARLFIRVLDGLFRVLDNLISVKLKLESRPELGELSTNIKPEIEKQTTDCKLLLSDLIKGLTNQSKELITRELRFWGGRKNPTDTLTRADELREVKIAEQNLSKLMKEVLLSTSGIIHDDLLYVTNLGATLESIQWLRIVSQKRMALLDFCDTIRGAAQRMQQADRTIIIPNDETILDCLEKILRSKETEQKELFYTKSKGNGRNPVTYIKMISGLRDKAIAVKQTPLYTIGSILRGENSNITAEEFKKELNLHTAI